MIGHVCILTKAFGWEIPMKGSMNGIPAFESLETCISSGLKEAM